MSVLQEQFKEQRKEHLAAGLAWQNEWNLCFTYPNGRYIPPQTALKHFKKIAAKIGRPDARFHDLRHPYVKLTTKNISEKQKSISTNEL